MLCTASINKRNKVSACTCDVYQRALRAGELSQATDTYSVGVLLLELITGLPAADGGRAPGHRLLAQALAPRLGDVAALQVGGPEHQLHALCFADSRHVRGQDCQDRHWWHERAMHAAGVPAVVHARCHRWPT